MKKILLLFLMSLIIISCDDTDDSTALVFDQKSFNTNRELWESSGTSNYTFTQEFHSLSIGGQPNLTTVILDNELDTIYTQSSSDSDYAIESLVYFETIDDIFDHVNYIVECCNEEINSSESKMVGAKIVVEYDDSLYYPTKITCVGYYPEDYYGGLSEGITISDFEIK